MKEARDSEEVRGLSIVQVAIKVPYAGVVSILTRSPAGANWYIRYLA